MITYAPSALSLFVPCLLEEGVDGIFRWDGRVCRWTTPSGEPVVVSITEYLSQTFRTPEEAERAIRSRLEWLARQILESIASWPADPLLFDDATEVDDFLVAGSAQFWQVFDGSPECFGTRDGYFAMVRCGLLGYGLGVVRNLDAEARWSAMRLSEVW